MKTAIVGANGQLGQELLRTLPGEIVGLNRAEADLSRPETFLAALDSHRPNIVINCAAYNFVDRAEDEPAEAFTVNAFGVRGLARECERRGCLLVHFSTDYVFGRDEGRRIPYTESDVPGPLSVYGTSKLAGEYCVQADCRRHFVVRTCGLYGSRGKGGKGTNFVEAILARAASGLPISVVDDQECTPTSAAALARAMPALISSDAFGLYHITSAASCSRFTFARRILALAAVNAPVTPIATSALGGKARRPAYSVLDCSKASRVALGMKTWEDGLREYLASRS